MEETAPNGMQILAHGIGLDRLFTVIIVRCYGYGQDMDMVKKIIWSRWIGSNIGYGQKMDMVAIRIWSRYG